MENLFKFQLFLFCFLSISISVKSQDTTTVYFNKKWKITKKEKAQYIQEEIKLDSNRYVIRKMTVNRRPVSICHYKSINPTIEHGIVNYFDENGKIAISGSYNEGYMDGLWYIYNQSKSTYDTLNYHGVKEIYLGEYDDYSYESSEIFFIVEEMPRFGYSGKSGKEEFREYIAQNLHYPIRALENQVEGRVFIQFVVGADGRVIMPKAVVKADRDLTFEAIRVIKDSPQWVPGKQRNMPISVQFTFPIVFVLIIRAKYPLRCWVRIVYCLVFR